jgi:hypothetical protein
MKNNKMDSIHSSNIPEVIFPQINHIFEITKYEIMLHLFTIWRYYYKKRTHPSDSLQYSESMQHLDLGTQGVQQKVSLSS